MKFSALLMVGLGGGLGSLLRFVIGGYAQQWSKSLTFPFGTLAVNVIGCFAIGALAHLAEARGAFTQELRAFLFIGLLGGFTTFSSFGNDTLNLFREGQSLLAAINVIAQLVLGLLAVWLGRALAYVIWR